MLSSNVGKEKFDYDTMMWLEENDVILMEHNGIITSEDKNDLMNKLRKDFASEGWDSAIRNLRSAENKLRKAYNLRNMNLGTNV